MSLSDDAPHRAGRRFYDVPSDRLGVLEVKIDACIEALKAVEARLQVPVTDHEHRIRHIERWVWGAIGALTVLQALSYFPLFHK